MENIFISIGERCMCAYSKKVNVFGHLHRNQAPPAEARPFPRPRAALHLTH